MKVVETVEDFVKKQELKVRQKVRNRAVANATEEQKRNEAFRWTLIALTRPIDSTVITLRDKDSELGKVLQEVHAAHPSIIDWIS